MDETKFIHCIVVSDLLKERLEKEPLDLNLSGLTPLHLLYIFRLMGKSVVEIPPRIEEDLRSELAEMGVLKNPEPVFTKEGRKLADLLDELLKQARSIVDGDLLLSLVDQLSAY